jgi:hypothetical protein
VKITPANKQRLLRSVAAQLKANLSTASISHLRGQLTRGYAMDGQMDEVARTILETFEEEDIERLIQLLSGEQDEIEEDEELTEAERSTAGNGIPIGDRRRRRVAGDDPPPFRGRPEVGGAMDALPSSYYGGVPAPSPLSQRSFAKRYGSTGIAPYQDWGREGNGADYDRFLDLVRLRQQRPQRRAVIAQDRAPDEQSFFERFPGSGDIEIR